MKNVNKYLLSAGVSVLLIVRVFALAPQAFATQTITPTVSPIATPTIDPCLEEEPTPEVPEVTPTPDTTDTDTDTSDDDSNYDHSYHSHSHDHDHGDDDSTDTDVTPTPDPTDDTIVDDCPDTGSNDGGDGGSTVRPTPTPSNNNGSGSNSNNGSAGGSSGSLAPTGSFEDDAMYFALLIGILSLIYGVIRYGKKIF